MPSERHGLAAGPSCSRTVTGSSTIHSDQRVLLAEPEHKAVREMPGEGVEAGKAPYQAAARVV